MQKSFQRIFFGFFAFVLIIFVIELNSADGWKLRDLTQRGDENKAAAAKRSVFRDAPTNKIENIVTEVKNREQISKSETDNDDDDDDDNDDTKKVVFEKVRSTHFDLPTRSKTEKYDQLDDGEAEDDEEDDSSESDKEDSRESNKNENEKEEDESPSLLDKILNYIPFWSKTEETVENADTEPTNFFSWFSWFRKLENQAQEVKKTEDPENDISKIDWFSYLNRKPFNLFINFEAELEDEKSKTKDDTEKSDFISNTKRDPLTTEKFEQLLLHLPSFVPNYLNVDNIDCKRMGQIFQRQVRGQKLWALQMMDASAKIPSGLLRGNANQLGDYDLCTEIRTKIKVKDEKSIKIKGKYCLANVDVVAIDEDLKLPVHLMQGRNLLRSRLEDPSHFIPRFSTLKWGICLPNACTNEDAEQILTEFLSPFNVTGVHLYVQVESSNCYGKNRKNWIIILEENWQMCATIGFFIFFTVVMVVASLNDYWKVLKLDVLFAPDASKLKDENTEEKSEPKDENEKEKDKEQEEGLLHQALMTFSIKKTVGELFHFPDEFENETVYCIYGLKGLATVMLFFTLKFLQIGHLPFTNRAHLTEMLDSPVSIFIRTALLYTEVFLMASGFLAGYKMSMDLDQHNRILWFRRLIARIVRLCPSMIAVVLFTIWIWPHLGSGPQWGNLVEQNSELCRENYWSNLLFFQNWFPVKDQCLPQLLQLSVDSQLFLIAPVFVWLFHSNHIVGFGIFGLVHAFSVATRFSSTITERLSYVVFHGMKLSQLYRILNFTLASPLQRATSYFVGLGLGVMLFQAGRDAKLPKALFTVGWMSTFSFIFWCLWSPIHLSSKDYVYDPNEAAQYATWAPLLWSLALSWIVFVVFTRNDGIITRILTAKLLIFISRISYQIFLIQFVVLLHFGAQVRSTEAFNIGSAINPPEILIILVIAVLMTLLFDLPFKSISKMIIYYHVNDEVQEIESTIKSSAPEEVTENDDTSKEVEELSNESANVFSKLGHEFSPKRNFSPVWMKDDEEPSWGAGSGDEEEPLSQSKSEEISEELSGSGEIDGSYSGEEEQDGDQDEIEEICSEDEYEDHFSKSIDSVKSLK